MAEDKKVVSEVITELEQRVKQLEAQLAPWQVLVNLVDTFSESKAVSDEELSMADAHIKTWQKLEHENARLKARLEKLEKQPTIQSDLFGLAVREYRESQDVSVGIRIADSITKSDMLTTEMLEQFGYKNDGDGYYNITNNVTVFANASGNFVLTYDQYGQNGQNAITGKIARNISFGQFFCLRHLLGIV